MKQVFKELRKERGLSVADLASALKVSENHFYSLQAGRRVIGVRMSKRMSKVFGVSYLDFINDFSNLKKFERRVLENVAKKDSVVLSFRVVKEEADVKKKTMKAFLDVFSKKHKVRFDISDGVVCFYKN